MNMAIHAVHMLVHERVFMNLHNLKIYVSGTVYFIFLVLSLSQMKYIFKIIIDPIFPFFEFLGICFSCSWWYQDAPMSEYLIRYQIFIIFRLYLFLDYLLYFKPSILGTFLWYSDSQLLSLGLAQNLGPF